MPADPIEASAPPTARQAKRDPDETHSPFDSTMPVLPMGQVLRERRKPELAGHLFAFRRGIDGGMPLPHRKRMNMRNGS